MRISDWSSDVCSSDLVPPMSTPRRYVIDCPRDSTRMRPRPRTGAARSEAQRAGDANSRVALATGAARSEERRVGKECVSPCRSRGSPYHLKQKQTYEQTTTQ